MLNLQKSCLTLGKFLINYKDLMINMNCRENTKAKNIAKTNPLSYHFYMQSRYADKYSHFLSHRKPLLYLTNLINLHKLIIYIINVFIVFVYLYVNYMLNTSYC